MLLHRVVRENLETCLARSREACADHDPVPPHVERTFRKYLECGILAHGFARVVCDRCKHEFLVAFSCKQWGVCPSCNTRRMVETAAYLVDHVLPRVAMRQWVLAVPKRIRWFVQNDRDVASRVWAMLIARIYEVLPLLRLRCNAPMRIISFIAEAKTITKILEHIGEPSTAPVIAPARGPPQEEFAYDA